MKKNNDKVLLLIVLLIVAGIITYVELSKPKIAAGSAVTGDEGQGNAPELQGIEGYINTDENISIKALKGKVVLLDFWTYSCINCIRTLPYLTAWDRKYRDQGLVIIGVHTPEFSFEEKRENVLAAVERNNIEYAVVLDNNYATWNAYKNRYWPRKYLIDRNGDIVFDHIGEGGYAETERKIQELLEMEYSPIVDVVDETPRTFNTPELYAGYRFAFPRGQDVENSGGITKDQFKDFMLEKPDKFSKDKIYLEGRWKGTSEKLEKDDKIGSIFLKFTATNANIVAEGDAIMKVFIDGQPIGKDVAGKDVEFDDENGYIDIGTPRLYEIYKGPYGAYNLELRIDGNFSFHSFTFG